MTKTIPAQTEITYDLCSKICQPHHRRHEAQVSVKCHSLDYHGSPAANGSFSLDLCDDCLHLHEFRQWLTRMKLEKQEQP